MAKSESSELRDRLSELPDSLIFHIFWFLPMDSFVRTAVLSSRWKTLWTTTPYLNFRFSYGTFEPRDFVNRALLSWRGVRTLKFRIEFIYSELEDDEQDESLCIDFDLWIRFAVEKKVEELYFPQLDRTLYEYKVPQCLYACSSLKVLLLPGCYIHINGNVQWNQLNSLSTDGGIESHHVLNHVLCGTPQLEVLILTCWDGGFNFSIRSSSLRKLLIENIACVPVTECWELRIWAPNLETLEISGDPYGKNFLMNVSSLTHANLGFLKPVEIRREDFSGDDFFGETLWQIFPPLQHEHVGMARLLNWGTKMREHAAEVNSVSPFSNIMFLNLKECQPSLKCYINTRLKFVP